MSHLFYISMIIIVSVVAGLCIGYEITQSQIDKVVKYIKKAQWVYKGKALKLSDKSIIKIYNISDKRR